MWLALWLATQLATAAATAPPQRIDVGASRVAFTLQTRWGQSLRGRFDRFEGEIHALPDARHQVRLRLSAAALQIEGSPRYTQLARGAGFFDARRHPRVSFVSDGYPDALLRGGGALGGQLTVRGITRHERFRIEPGDCAVQPRCTLTVRGTIHRGHYGMNTWEFAIRPQVELSLRLRLEPAG